MPTFASPMWLFGLLAALPALLAIYWLRQRARERQVSSLLLWRAERERWDGGRRWERLQLPILFWLELLVLLALFGAAARPMWQTGESSRPLVVVLDDSFSMLAGQGETARERAIQALTSELGNAAYAPVQFVLAGERPQLLGATRGKPDETARLLQQWRCGAAAARMDEAIAFGFALGGKRARVLAVSDHAPAETINESRLQWWAFGQPQPNVAFVNAARSTRGADELILLEIANLSAQRQTPTLTLEQAAQTVDLAPNESKRLTFKRPANAAPFQAKLSDDALTTDNAVVLLPEDARRVRINLRIADAELRVLVERALQSISAAVVSDVEADLLISDTENGSAPERWTLQLIKEGSASSYLGPFVVDRTHPLTEGLSFGGVVWAAGAATQLPGQAIVLAGNLPLLTDLERDSGRHELRLRLQPGLSTLQLSPNWPILWWNLINWRASVTPGLREHNVRLGSAVEYQTSAATIRVTAPQQSLLQLPVTSGRVRIAADTPGLVQISDGATSHQLAVNALQQTESDLRKQTAGHWGNWASAADFVWEYRNFAWVFLLLALVFLSVHGWLLLKNKRAA